MALSRWTLRRSVWWCAVAILAAGVVLAWGSPQAPKRRNPKDLMKEAQSDKQNNRWEDALEKLKDAFAQKPKDKNIAAALKQAQEFLADRTASQAMDSCSTMKLDTCEQQIKLALSYAPTQQAEQAQSQLTARKTELQNRWNRIQQMMGAGQLEEAYPELEGLTPFPYLFPTLDAEKNRLRLLRLRAALDQGMKNKAEERFDAAAEAFNTALRIDPGNSEAVRGIDSSKKEKEAFTAYQQAMNAVSSKSFEIAYRSNQKAMALFPERQQYQDLEKQISAQWLEVLIDDAHNLSSNPENLEDNQKALEALGWIRRLDPRYQGLPEAMRNVRMALYSNSIQKASEYQALPDNSRIAVAYLYYLNAQSSNPEGEFAFAAKLREVGSLFARKRVMQVLVNVQNLSPAAPSFSEVVSRRVRAGIERLGLPDLKLVSLEEYQKNPGEDPQFQDNRPDGKSPSALFTMGIMNYETESSGNDKPADKPSKFVSGQETVPNPEYAKIMDEYRKVRAALLRDKPKPGKATREGFTPEDLSVLERQIPTVNREITHDRIAEYTYQEYSLRARAQISMNLEIRDMLEKQLMGSDTLDVIREEKATEVSGVRDKDVNNLLNRPARLKSTDQMLRESERDALQALDEKVQLLMAKYIQRYYNEGEKALREGRHDDALENFLCYWYTFRGQMDQKQSQHIVEVVKQMTGFELSATGPLPASPQMPVDN